MSYWDYCSFVLHRDYSNPYVAQFLIEKDCIIVKNGNRAHGMGVLNINTFEPFSKNPAISKVFREIGLADELGSGMRNSYKYTRLYSGGEPEFIEGDVFKIIIPLSTGAMTKVGPRVSIENDTETTQNSTETTQNDTKKDFNKPTEVCDVEIDIVKLIKGNPYISIRKMTEKRNGHSGR